MKDHPERGMKIAALAAGALGLAGAFVLASIALKGCLAGRPQYARWFWPGLTYLWAVLLPGYLALGEFWKICTQIGRDNSFSRENARSLSRIRALLLIAGGLSALGAALMLLLRLCHPGLLLLAGGAAAACALVALLAGALCQLVRRAAALKDENDLTI